MDAVVELVEKFRLGVTLRDDRSYTFSGDDAVTWLISNGAARNPTEALTLGSGMMRLGVFASTGSDDTARAFANSSSEVYQFTDFWRDAFPCPNPVREPRSAPVAGSAQGALVKNQSWDVRGAGSDKKSVRNERSRSVKPNEISSFRDVRDKKGSKGAAQRGKAEMQQREDAGPKPLNRANTYRGMVCSIPEMAERIMANIEIKDRRWKVRTFKDCFVGSDAVSYMVKSDLAINEFEAVDYGTDMIRMGLVSHVTGSHKALRNDDSLYRFIRD